MQYAELHCHSSFSLLDGASAPEELIVEAKNLGLSALAITDHNDLGGIVRFAQAGKDLAMPAIIGAELTLDDSSHLTLLVETIEGYKNLCHLITTARSHCPRGTPYVTWQYLKEHAAGLIALSGCPHGKIPTYIAAGEMHKAKQLAGELKECFGENFFLELWNHHLKQEAIIAGELLEIGKALSVACVATNNVHYATPGKRVIHDVLTCLRHEVTLSAAGRRLRPNSSWHLKSASSMLTLFADHKDAIKNTLLIAERCQFRLGLLKPSLPDFAVPQGMTTDEYLRHLVYEGAKTRYPCLTEKERKQIEHELNIIAKLKVAPYFLIMHDIVRFAQAKGIAVQGRGSAANSAVCYCLFITAVDPVGMDLLFERFMSEGRDEPPDIDLDIAHQERETVLQYVYNKYGREHAAMVCETITYRGRSATRDAARVLGFSQAQADKLASQAQFSEAKDAAYALAEGGAARAGLDAQERLVRLLIYVVAGLHQLPRHRSIHVGGFVLSGEPLGNIVPIEPASMAHRTVIQWDKDDLGPAGMIKIDLLGLGMLTLIQEAVKLVKKHRGIDLDLAHLNMNDPQIYDMLQKADTIGIFQVESRAQMNILPRLRPSCFYDIVVSIALVRPGPIQGNIVHPYIRRRRGEETVTYLHPSLEPILKRTLGVPLFQEQGMRLAVVAAGFSAEQADQLRRVMSHKRSKEKMERLCEALSAGMEANNFSTEAIKTITHQLQAFANYGFPESHAASFGLLVYASAYLKKYFAAEFYCAILNAQPMGFYSPATLVRDAMRHQIKVLPPDLTKSSWDCTLEDSAPETDAQADAKTSSEGNSADTQKELCLRLGLHYVQGLGQKAKAQLEKAWASGGTFTSIEDVCLRAGLGIKSLQLLAQAGAFDSLCHDRRESIWQVLAQARKQGQRPLEKMLAQLTGKDSTASTGEILLPTMTPLETIIADYRTLGLSTGPHPMSFYRSWAEKNNIVALADVVKKANGQYLTIAGGVICRQRPGTAKGFVFITLEDETGMANVVVKPKIFDTYRKTLLENSFVSISGALQIHEGVANLIAEHIDTLPVNARQIHLASRDFQ
jgi:error-prone DNA polymerase